MRIFLLSLFVGIGVALLVFGLFFFRPTITVTVAPEGAKILLGGEEAKSFGKFTVWPGTYDFSITKDGFVPLIRRERLKIGQRLSLTINLKALPVPLAATLEPVFLIGLSADKRAVLFVGDSGRTLFSQEEKKRTPLSPPSFGNPIAFKMSPDQDVALFRTPNGDVFLHDFGRYDLVEQPQFLFSRHIGDFDWIYPAGERVLYSYLPPTGEKTLIVADRAGKEAERIVNLRETNVVDPTIAVSPDGKTAILVSRPGSNYSAYNLFILELGTKKLKQLTTDGRKVNARFSPGGQRIIYTRFAEDPDGLNNQLLSVMDADGKNRKDFNLRSTLDQIDFLDESNIVAAVTDKRGDELVGLNLSTGEETRYYYKKDQSLYFNKIAIAPDRKSLWTTGSRGAKEKYGTLYRINLETDKYE